MKREDNKKRSIIRPLLIFSAVLIAAFFILFDGLGLVGVGDGEGIGAVFGGMIATQVGLQYIGYSGAILAGVGFILTLYLISRSDFLTTQKP